MSHQPLHAMTLCEILRDLGGTTPTRAPVKYAEIGVEQGRTLSLILRNLPSVHAWAVDTWESYDMSDAQHQGESYGIVPKSTQQENYRLALEALDPWTKVGGRCRVYRMPSVLAADALSRAGEKMHCVFIDADHREAAVYADIKAGWPLVAPGGILCGHDFGSWYGVERAVGWFMDEEPAANKLDVLPGYVWAIKRPSVKAIEPPSVV